MNYTEFEQKHREAYATFKAIYEQKLPPPEPVIVQSENRWTIGALAVMVFASVIVSGSRTIIEFGGGLVGGSGFVMLELGMVVYAYIRTALYYDESRHSNVKALLSRGMWLAFVVAIVANVHATFKANGLDLQVLNIVIVGLLAISAPTLALIAGDVLGMLVVRDSHRQRKADEEYKRLLVDYMTDLNTAWARQQRAWGVHISVHSEEMSTVQLDNGQSNGQQIGQQALPAASTLGHKKAPNASAIARQYFAEHPEALDIPARDLVPIIGAGKSTINNVQNELKLKREGE